MSKLAYYSSTPYKNSAEILTKDGSELFSLDGRNKAHDFELIIVVVVVVKLLFWTIYLCIRKRRMRRQMQSRIIDTCYEEVPAVPQPAYVFSGLSPEDLRHAALIESLPGYQAEDPYKRDLPPPSYGENFHSNTTNDPQCSTSASELIGRRTLEELAHSLESTDTSRLLNNMEDEEDDFICLQQMT